MYLEAYHSLYSLIEKAPIEQALKQKFRTVLEQASFEVSSDTEALNFLIDVCLQNSLEEPLFADCAARFMLMKIYSEVAGVYELDYRSYFRSYIEDGVGCGALDDELLNFDLDKLSSNLKPERDFLLSFTGLYTLYDRYLVRHPETRKLLETPQAFWMRVAMGLSLHEKERESWAIRFYDMLSQLRYLPSTPTLFNSGTPHHQLASCYLYDVNDSLDHILESAYEFGMIAKYAGGIGTSVSKIRAIGSPVKGVNGKSGGLIPFLRVYDSLISAISQGGRRRGTMCVYLEPWHLEVETFLDLKRNTGDPSLRTPHLNTALWVPDEFMHRVLRDDDWYLFDPLYVPGLTEAYGQKFSQLYAHYCEKAEKGQLPKRAWRKMKARDLYLKMLASLFETGHPWITFKDPSNIRSMLRDLGMIHSANLCTEVVLPTCEEEIAVCNLASINLVAHLRDDGEIDWMKLAETVQTAVRGLDNAIDLNLYTTEKARRSNMNNRPLGLGLMGFAEVLARKGIVYGSRESVELADRLLEFILYHAIIASHRLSLERGVFPNFERSLWANGRLPFDTVAELERERGESSGLEIRPRLDWENVRLLVRRGMRNGTLLAIAPTATISLIAGTTPGLDPYFSNIYSRQTLSGKFFEINRYLVEELKQAGIWERVKDELVQHQGELGMMDSVPEHIKRRYPTAFEIDPLALIELTAAAQKWVDMAISRSLYLRANSPADVAKVYVHAWRLGLKSTYYCFVKPRMRVEPYTININKALNSPSWLLETQEEVKAVYKPEICGAEVCESCD